MAARLRGESFDIGDSPNVGESRHRRTNVPQLAPHERLVLRVDEGRRRRLHVDALALQGLQERGRNMLVVKGDDGGILGRPAQIVQLGMRTKHDIGVTCAAGSSAAWASTRRV